MDHLRLGLGTVWIVFTVFAAALLGSDFILNEIRAYVRHHRDSGAK